MTEVAVPDTIPDNIMEIGVSELTIEGINSEMPCEIAAGHARGEFWNTCKSGGKDPATWIISHEGAQPQCTFLVCEACVVHLQHWIMESVVRGGPRSFGCGRCHKHYFHYSEFITRKL